MVKLVEYDKVAFPRWQKITWLSRKNPQMDSFIKKGALWPLLQASLKHIKLSPTFQQNRSPTKVRLSARFGLPGTAKLGRY